MFKTFQKKRTQFLILLAMIIALILPAICVSYADSGTGILGMRARYSDDIEPNDGDIFVIEYVNEDTGETGSFVIDASTISSRFKDYEMNAGYYAVTKITYTGDNQEIIDGGYGIESLFRITIDGDELLHIYIGKSMVEEMQADYNNAIVIDNEHDKNGDKTVYYDRAGNAYKYEEDEDGNVIIVYLEPDDTESDTTSSSSSSSDNSYDESYNDYWEDEIPAQTSNGQEPVVEYYDHEEPDENEVSTVEPMLIVILIFGALVIVALFWFHKKGKI